eukprot:TRINITY_DN11899_c0_g1_i3.p1 TRINITY_DN11899_c0_g1~~TRINITY_DN11899_c0_g1_i3.p1  ORF type:complete len:178 (-),score=2.62 TRINITY_DN11899_c0_g1_i3:1185-1718(-)
MCIRDSAKTYEQAPSTIYDPSIYTPRNVRMSYSTVRGNPYSSSINVSASLKKLETLRESRAARSNVQTNGTVPIIPLTLNVKHPNVVSSSLHIVRSASNKQRHELLRDGIENKLASITGSSLKMELSIDKSKGKFSTSSKNATAPGDPSVGGSLMQGGVVKAYAFNTNKGAVRYLMN